eukprot:13529172-Ditylum_brightwellii.AAC.1
MHIGENDKASKTEAIVFAAPGKDFTDYDVTRVPVAHGYITYTQTFKYLGSILSWDLDDRPDIDNQILQAQKALQAMMPKVFRNPENSTRVKRMLYLAILLNLLIWGCETWALKVSDQKHLQCVMNTFKTKPYIPSLKLTPWILLSQVGNYNG